MLRRVAVCLANIGTSDEGSDRYMRQSGLTEAMAGLDRYADRRAAGQQQGGHDVVERELAEDVFSSE